MPIDGMEGSGCVGTSDLPGGTFFKFQLTLWAKNFNPNQKGINFFEKKFEKVFNYNRTKRE